MRLLFNLQCLLVLLLFVTLFAATQGKRGGGSRGGSSRSRSSSSSRTSTRYSDRYREKQRQSAPAPQPKPQPIKPSAPEEPKVVRQPAQNPNYHQPSPNQPASNPNYPGNRGQNAPGNQQPPPYGPAAGPPPPYSPVGQPPPHAPGGAPPAYSPGAAPPAYSPAGQPPAPGFRQPIPSQPGVNPYPQQPGMGSAPYPQQPGMRPAPYPQQPGMGSAPYPQQPGMRPAPYPQQPGMGSAPYPQQPGMRPAPYPQQPGMRPAPYPQQPGMSYPRQPGMSYPQQPLGSNVWQPQSGRPAPAYMNYGGLPTGANMYQAPYKKKGFLGSMMSMGGKKHKNKYYGSRPGLMGGVMGGALGGAAVGGLAMAAILPYMAARSVGGLFRPRLGFFPISSPFYHHHHYGYGYDQHHYYDVYSENYIGKCQRPITPVHGAVQCNSTRRETKCLVNCTEGYYFPDNETSKDNHCWHVTGVWRPTKNFPDCQPICNETCLNGGSCIKPDVCGCPAEYRGPHCEFHFLKCDVRKLAAGIKISWVCTHTKNETTCRVKCKPPAIFASKAASEYKCTPDGTWTPDALPPCIVKEELNGTLSEEVTTPPTVESTIAN